MRPTAEPLGIAVRENPHESDGGEHQAHAVQESRRNEENQRGDNDRCACLAHRQPTRGKLAPLGARVPGILIPVDDTVETHGREAGSGKRHHDEHGGAPRNRPDVRRIHHAQERKRQGKRRVRELHEVGEMHHHRTTRKGLALNRQLVGRKYRLQIQAPRLGRTR